MNGVTIRYRKSNWKNWSYLTVKTNEVNNWVTSLELQGYIVETAM